MQRAPLFGGALALPSPLLLSLLITIKINVDRQAAFLCSHVQEQGLDMSTCPAHENTLSWVIVLSFAVTVLLFLGGMWIVVASRPRPSKREVKPIQTSSLSDEEKQIYDILKTNDGTVYQNQIVDMTGFGKVRVTRILDKMESADILERKRRGMTNLVVLK